MTDNLHIAQLNYGYAGVGKTYTATSAIWNHEKREFNRNGYWLRIGREDNASITMPETTLKRATEEGEFGQIRLGSPSLDDDSWSRNFQRFCRWMLQHNKKAADAERIGAVVIDGMSEFDLLFESVHHNVHGDGNKYKKWDDLLGAFFAAFQMLDPDELGAHVIMTARVRERDESNPIPFDYIPSVRGSFKSILGHYFHLVTYFDVTTRKVGGSIMPVVRAHMLPDGDRFQVKNNWMTQWAKGGHGAVVENPTFDGILAVCEELNGQ